jgi:hypothetical protein
MKKQLIAFSMAGLMLASTATTALARDYRHQGYANRYYSEPAHPYVQKAVLGGGAGAALGGLLSRDGYRTDGAIKGALLGAGVGMGYEYLKRQGTFSNMGW